jgi:hypothetical protein
VLSGRFARLTRGQATDAITALGGKLIRTKKPGSTSLSETRLFALVARSRAGRLAIRTPQTRATLALRAKSRSRRAATFEIRSFDACLAALRASQRGEPRAWQDREERSYSFDDLAAWPENPPFTALIRLAPSEKMRDTPKEVLRSRAFGAHSLGTWNSHVRGEWIGEKGRWIICDCEIRQEQAKDWGREDRVHAILARWVVTEGIASAVVDDRPALLTAMMGLSAWPARGWKPFRGWYGE